jgi:hypothetical protein
VTRLLVKVGMLIFALYALANWLESPEWSLTKVLFVAVVVGYVLMKARPFLRWLLPSFSVKQPKNPPYSPPPAQPPQAPPFCPRCGAPWVPGQACANCS